MKTKKLILVNGIILTFTSLILRTIGISFSIYISNKIGSTAVGIFELLMSVYSFFVTFALSGINLACVRIVTDDLAYEKINNIKFTVKKCLLYSCSFGVTSSFILCLFAPFLSRVVLHSQVSNVVFYVISISLPFVSMSSSLNGYFLAVRKANKNAIIQVLEQIIKIAIILFLFNKLLPKNVDFAIRFLVIGTSISEIISFLTLYFLYKIDQNKLRTFRYEDTNLSQKILRISIPVAVTSYIRSFLSSIKQILIPLSLQNAGLSNYEALSFYGTINGMVFPVILFPNILITAFSRITCSRIFAF